MHDYLIRRGKRLPLTTLGTSFNLHFHPRYYANLELKIICQRLAGFRIVFHRISGPPRNLINGLLRPRTDASSICVLQSLRGLHKILYRLSLIYLFHTNESRFLSKRCRLTLVSQSRNMPIQTYQPSKVVLFQNLRCLNEHEPLYTLEPRLDSPHDELRNRFKRLPRPFVGDIEE